MRAIIINNFGGRDQLQMAERPRPVPGKGEVLIRVRAAGVNPVDTKICGGYLRFRLPHMFPIILGWDAAGVVEELADRIDPRFDQHGQQRENAAATMKRNLRHEFFNMRNTAL